MGDRSEFHRGINWSDEDTRLLIQEWTKEENQNKLNAGLRNLHVFELISRSLYENYGVERNAQQVGGRNRRDNDNSNDEHFYR